MSQRIQKLESLISQANLQALALNPGPSLSYLTGLHFHVSERPTILLIIPGRKPVLILPRLEIRKVQAAGVDYQLFFYEDNPKTWQPVFTKALQELGLQNASIGVEPEHMRVLELTFLQHGAPNAKFPAADLLIGKLRLQKDPDEILQMRKAVEIAQTGLIRTLPSIKPGVTEKEIASELTFQLLHAGSGPSLGFFPIIASGPNSAVGHHFPTDRKLQSGDLLVIDWGASFDGYIADLTRTFGIGSLEPKLIEIANVVLQANQAGRSAVKAGVSAGSVDQAAREVIASAGYGEQFVHRTGHGIGLEVHEPPYIFGGNTLTLAPGMTFTIEPGIYLMGIGGVRIEDNVVVTASGHECLTNLPRELQILS